MDKFLLMAALFLKLSSASAEPFSKEVQLNAGTVYFLADISDGGVDQFGLNIVKFSNPTVNGTTISFQSGDAEAKNLKTQVCEKLGYGFANGLGVTHSEKSFMGFFLDEDKQLTMKLFETQSRLTYFNCAGSL